MGCQHSRLTLLQNQNIQPNPPSSQPQDKKNITERSKVYEQKQNINSDARLKTKQKEIVPYSISVFDDQTQKVKEGRVDPKEVEIVAEAISKIQEDQRAERVKRRQKHLKSKSRAQFQAYFIEIVRSIKQQKEVFAKIIQQAGQKYCISFNRSLAPQDVDRLILAHLKTKSAPYFEVQRWLKEKIVIARVKGEELSKWLQQICSTWKQDKDLIPEILHVLIQDCSKTDISFNMKLSLQYQYKNTLVEVKEWQAEMWPLYRLLHNTSK